MATLNLGRIKPVFRGAYAGGTAYVVDDIVTSGNETFICILASTGNATSNATYWTKLAAKGTDGTDVGTTITTQGDILYRDGSGLQRLAKGTAAQVLKMNSGATAPEWGDLSSDYVKIHSTGAVSSGSYIGVNGHFSADYDLYEIRFMGLYVSSGSGGNIRARLYSDTSGTVETSSNYTNTQSQAGRDTGGSTYHSETGNNNGDYWYLQDSISNNDDARSNSVFTFYNPLATDRYTIMSYHQALMDGTSWVEPNWGMGMFNSTSTQCTGFVLYNGSSNTFSADDIIVYGIKT